MKLVAIFKGSTTADAEIVRSRLEVAEFHPVIINEHSGVEMMGGGGGVLVQVPESEAAEAKEFLSAGETPSE